MTRDEFEKYRPTDEQLKAFFDDIETVFKRHKMTISHEDGFGAFIIDVYRERNIEWLKKAFWVGDDEGIHWDYPQDGLEPDEVDDNFAEWLSTDRFHYCKCSACKTVFAEEMFFDNPDFRFCPWCGTPIKEEVDDEGGNGEE